MARAVQVVLVLALVGWGPAEAARYPDGFTEEVVLAGLDQPTQVAFAADGRIVIAEKSGVVKIFDGPGDETADVLVDLSLSVHNYWDRGMLGLALDPGFPLQPYVYVLYTHNFDVYDPDAGTPRWPTNGCPSVPGPTTDGCVVNGRLSRLEIDADNGLVGGEHVLLEGGWCAQFPSHTIGTLAFDTEGALYVSAGDGASALDVDWGQFGGSPDSPVPSDPCDDPPGGRGAILSPPTAEGGALRAQDLRTDGDPVTWSGSVLRIDPTNGAAWPTNPRVGGDPADDRVVAYGLRNPFRMTRRPGTNELWIGDVGWRDREEINRLAVPSAGTVPNYGWPCFEGGERQPDYDAANLDLCETLYVDNTNPALGPFFEYRRGVPIDPDEEGDPDPEALRCTRFGGSAISGLAFLELGGEGVYPPDYDGALFFADFPRQCIFVMRAGPDGLPDPATRATFGDGVTAPAQLLTGPAGALHYLNLANGELVRIAWQNTNTPPSAVATATPPSGELPLTVQFDASTSYDPDAGATLTYDWDLDGDGAYDDASIVDPTFVYTIAGEYAVRLRVTDERGDTGVAAVGVTAGNTPPDVTIVTPAPDVLWHAGEEIAFSGNANDAEDGPRPATAFHWEIVLHACNDDPEDCTQHTLAEFHGIDAGTFVAPNQPGPSRLEWILRVTDDGFGARDGGILTGTARRELQPQTVSLNFDTRPSGLDLRVDGVTATTPFTRTTVVGATSQLAAPTPQPGAGGVFHFLYWSDGGAASHTIEASATTADIEATYVFDCQVATCTRVLRVSPDGSALAPFTTIQAAVDALTPGARIEILPGTYPENVALAAGFDVTIEARDDGSGAPVTIDGAGGCALDLAGEATVTVRGLTFEGATGLRATAPTRLDSLRFGAAATCALELLGGAHAARDLTIASGGAAGITVAAGSTLDLDRVHVADVDGAAIATAGSTRIRNLLVHGSGTGVAIAAGGTVELVHATIANNDGAGVQAGPDDPDGPDGNVAIRASVVTGNAGGDIVGPSCDDVQWTASGRQDCAGQNGNISGAPLLDATFRPTAGSPLLDAGPAADTGDIETCADLVGEVRWLDHDGDGLPQVDLGAFERINADRPAAVGDLRWTSASDLAWTAPSGAHRHHVYRGTLGDVVTGSGLPCVDELDDDALDAAFHDPARPPPGTLFAYLVTAEDAGGVESTAGRRTCAERAALQRCP